MHIVEVIPKGVHVVSGVVNSVIELSTALAETGQNVTVLVPGRSEVVNEPASTALVDAGIDRLDVPGDAIVDVARRALGSIRAAGASVVHLHNGFSPFNNVLGAGLRTRRIPYVVTTHGVYAPEGLKRSRLRKRIAVTLLDRPLLQRAAACTALTSTEAGEIAAVAPRATIEVLPLGFKPAPVRDPRRFRRELGLGDDVRLAVYAGRFDIGHKRLDAAVRGIAAARADWALACVGGDDGTSPELVELARDLGVAHRVFFESPRFGASFDTVLAGGDVSVLLSKSEGLPRGLVQALAHGVPGLVSPEVAARLEGAGVEPSPWWVSGPEAVGAKLDEIASSDGESWEARRAAARRWAEGLQWNVVGPRWTRFFEELGQRQG